MSTEDSIIPAEHTNTLVIINDEIQIARNIIAKSNKPLPKVGTTNQEGLILSFYTGIPLTEDVTKLFKKNNPSTFLDWLKESEKDNWPVHAISYEKIRKLIYTEYLAKLRLPNRKTLKEAYANDYVEKLSLLILKTLRKLPLKGNVQFIDIPLKEHGFHWKRLGNSKKYIILEQPEKVAKRMRYLYQMKQVREANNAFVHVEVQTIDVTDILKENSAVTLEVAVAVSPQIGLIAALVTSEAKINVDKWLNDNLTEVPEDTVFVIEQSTNLKADENTVITEHSSKRDMVKWFQGKDIKINPNAHKGELFAMIEKYKSQYNRTSSSLQMLNVKYSKILFRSQDLSHGKYFEFLWDNLKKVKNDNIEDLKSEYYKIIKDTSNEVWNEHDSDMATFENTVLEEDEKLELVVDKLMESIKNNSLNETDFAECEQDLPDFEYMDSIITK